MCMCVFWFWGGVLLYSLLTFLQECNIETMEDAGVSYSAKVMIVNPQKKKDYNMVKCQPIPEGVSLDSLQEILLQSFPEGTRKPHIEEMEFGYIEPGHGLKGKKEWIFDDDDIKRMIEAHTGGKKAREIYLWCYCAVDREKTKKSRSRSKSPRSKSPKSRASRYDAQVSKMSKVDEIFKKLDKNHPKKFTPEQKRAWAHLIELGKHDSYDEPPKKRFFQQVSKQSSENEASVASASQPSTSSSLTTSISAEQSTTTPVLSAGHRVGIRSECIDQLQKWHSLYKNGAVTKEQYDDLQSSILSDIHNL